MSEAGAASTGPTRVPCSEMATAGTVASGDLRERLSAYRCKIETKIFARVNRRLGRRPSSFPYVSGDSFRRLATHIIEGSSQLSSLSVRAGDVIFCETHRLRAFALNVLPTIAHPIVLVSHNSDDAVDSTVADIADSRVVSAWFAQNNLLNHPKVVSIPIGLENAHHHNYGIVGDFDRLRSRSAKQEKIPRIVASFTISTNPVERRAACLALQQSRVSDWVRLSSRQYRETVQRYMYVASPQGNGIDCHRTWEALYLGAIPIVRRTAFVKGFQGLPVRLVDHWSEVVDLDEADLGECFRVMRPKVESCPFLWMPYWAKRIADARNVAIRS